MPRFFGQQRHRRRRFEAYPVPQEPGIIRFPVHRRDPGLIQVVWLIFGYALLTYLAWLAWVVVRAFVSVVVLASGWFLLSRVFYLPEAYITDWVAIFLLGLVFYYLWDSVSQRRSRVRWETNL